LNETRKGALFVFDGLDFLIDNTVINPPRPPESKCRRFRGIPCKADPGCEGRF